MDSTATPRQITLRWLARLALLFFLGIVVLIALFVIWRVNVSKETARALASIQKAGYPISLAELEQKYYPLVAEKENAAPLFENAFASLHVTNAGKNKIPTLPDYQSTNKIKFISQTNLDRIAKLLADNHEALELLRRSPPITNCRYPIDLSMSFGTLLPHLLAIKDSAQLLSFEAIVHARNGDTAAAVEDLNGILRLSHSLDREPVLVSQLVRLSTKGLANNSLEYMLNSEQFSEAQLAGLSQALRKDVNPAAMEHAFAAELCEGIDFFQMSYSRMQALGRQSDPEDPTPSPSRAADLNSAYRSLRGLGLFARDYCFFLEVMAEHLRIVRLPFPEKLDAETQLGQRVSQTTSNHYILYMFSGLTLPSLNSIHVKEAQMEARMNIIQVVLAVERFRLANQNRLPDKLSDLVPSLLDSVPMDPFDGKPIRYKKLSKGYMIYSIGRDRKDDGGIYADRPKPGAPSDITFVIER